MPATVPGRAMAAVTAGQMSNDGQHLLPYWPRWGSTPLSKVAHEDVAVGSAASSTPVCLRRPSAMCIECSRCCWTSR